MLQDRRSTRSLTALLVVVVVAGLVAGAQGQGKQNGTHLQLEQQMKELDPCIVGSVFSFLERSRIPTTVDQLKTSCEAHSEAYRCARAKSKQVPAVVRRGVSSLVTNMQRFTRKHCAAERQRKTADDLRCVVEKHWADYEALDTQYANSMYQIYRLQFRDSALELKNICCALYKFKRGFAESAPQCPASKPLLEELIASIVVSDAALLCDDEEQLLSKVCPKLAPLKLPKSGLDPMSASLGPSAVAMLLVATLGEA